MDKYQIIYADPPWAYRGKMMNSSVTDHYSVMAAGNLEGLPVSSIAADDCILFLWVTMPKLNECMPLIEAWGFEYKTVAFTWVKTNKNSMGLFWGLGRWTRANAELCLLATKGHPPRQDKGIHQVVMSQVLDHAHKPAIVRELIVRLCGDLPRIELFARHPVEGWDVWGNQVESDVEL